MVDDPNGKDLNNPEYWKEKGNEFFKLKNYEESINCYIAAIKINKNFAPAWNNLSLALRKIGKDKESQDCLNHYNKLIAKSSVKNSNRGIQKSSFLSFFSNAISPLFKKDSNSQFKPATDVQKTITPPHPKIEITFNFGAPDIDTGDIQKLKFAGLGETLKIGNYKIIDPITYWSDETSGDASCINLRLPIGREVFEDRRALPYYPQYSQISPEQRANYLAWLSKGKQTEVYSPGYLFIYFYGLERRIIVDKKDQDIIIPEIRRLLSIYSSENSVNAYFQSLLSYIVGSSLDISEQKLRESFPDLMFLTDESLIIALAWFYENKKAISWDIAFSIGRKLSQNYKPYLLKNIQEEFKTLFKKKYSNLFPNGILLSCPETPYKFEYRTASPTLINYRYQDKYQTRSNSQIFLPNPLGEPHQFENIVKIFDECIESLLPFSRKINKTNGEITVESFCALPDELKDSIQHPDKGKWDHLFEAHKKDNFSLIPAGEICTLLNIEKREILTKKQSNMLTLTGQDIGYQVIPDPKLSGKPYRWADIIGLFPYEKKRTPLTNNFYAAALIFDLAYSVALSDAPVTNDEMKHLNQKIFTDFVDLTEFERDCLICFQEIRKYRPEPFDKQASRLKEHLTLDQRITVSNFLIEIAFFDNVLTSDEQKALKKAFSALDIDSITSDTLIAQELSARDQEKPVIIQKGVKIRKGEPIPQPVSNIPTIVIDSEKLIQTRRNTEEVQKVLVLVFNDQDSEIESLNINPSCPNADVEEQETRINTELTPLSETAISKLEARYYPILSEILKINQMTFDEFDALVRNFGCMPQATLQEINTWSDEEFGDFLLEENNGTIIVNHQDILQ